LGGVNQILLSSSNQVFPSIEEIDYKIGYDPDFKETISLLPKLEKKFPNIKHLLSTSELLGYNDSLISVEGSSNNKLQYKILIPKESSLENIGADPSLLEKIYGNSKEIPRILQSATNIRSIELVGEVIAFSDIFGNERKYPKLQLFQGLVKDINPPLLRDLFSNSRDLQSLRIII
jgi:hypothetical protein